MTRNVELLKADVMDELERIDQIKREFLDIADVMEIPESEVSTFHKGGLGYYLHNFYNGCENIFIIIAKFFENDISDESWHSDLLKRMKLEIPGYRPAVIDEKLYKQLDEFRGFRHVFRHIYGFNLDWEREKFIAGKLVSVIDEFTKQVEGFLQKIDL